MWGDIVLSTAVFSCIFQYTMLSGRAPFRGQSRDASVATIMQRIKEGEFSVNGKEWSHVSDEAKRIIQGNPTALRRCSGILHFTCFKTICYIRIWS